MSERVGLTTLVERAAPSWYDTQFSFRDEFVPLTEFGDLSLPGEFLRMSRAGIAATAWWKISDFIKPLRGWSPRTNYMFLGVLRSNEHDPAATRFWIAIEQISRLDDFLFALEADPRCRPLARDCRDDLALLNVLADWCEDNGRPVAAAEARHLWALVASILRE